jgi:hypothetical protein
MKEVPTLSIFLIIFTGTVIPAIIGAEFDLTFGILSSLLITFTFMYVSRESKGD